MPYLQSVLSRKSSHFHLLNKQFISSTNFFEIIHFHFVKAFNFQFVRNFLSNFYFSPSDSPSKAIFVYEIIKCLYFRLHRFFSLSVIALEVDSKKILKFMTSSSVKVRA